MNRKRVMMDRREVQTTSWAASCPSLFISSAMIALDTATGVPNRAMKAAMAAGAKYVT